MRVGGVAVGGAQAAARRARPHLAVDAASTATTSTEDTISVETPPHSMLPFLAGVLAGVWLEQTYDLPNVQAQATQLVAWVKDISPESERPKK